ncbi:tRNA modification GTPase GTPBP3, mitochondrial isoform X2 [Polistes fuscatus]|nr:tRNA modification GTPase GTPBP3, mitochondrial isoform X2 [Polistes fuscatus]XP_043504248.1 tRNA modification GTPase GTPBP3, mitochondrial isoform X2 [Polistes fuscatus]XP_043504249.1 tRNA modification GTPase GTPBP3, mitochondrial isoform X2 [Polistes fuscatus]XP_043504250.1 tRNA modification GTPase GTPBP3, mitochondrial isoform X2 [Polistes fuscatus]
MTTILKLEPRKAVLKKILDPETKEEIDKGLCLWFPGPKSFTGEDCVEFHVHGGPAILSSLMNALSKLNFYQAMPGEFTRRAFYNNKLDLVEIEGLADLIEAETERQRKQALSQASGRLSKLYKDWRERLVNIIANLEAYIDFNEEDNIEDNILENCNSSIKSLIEDIERHLSDNRSGEILRNGIRTVIIGKPNVGKSTILNYLVQRNAAIVSPIAGTTRDIIELKINISGYPMILADTAGFSKNPKDPVEKEGILRAKAYAENVDLVILVMDSSEYLRSGMTYSDYIKEYLNNMNLNELLRDECKKKCIVIANKIDLLNEKDKEIIKKEKIVATSFVTEEGLSDITKTMINYCQELCCNTFNEDPVISQNRYRNHLSKCLKNLQNYIEMVSNENYDAVIAVEEIRFAMRELGMITGHVYNDEILNNIFTHFCIGK